MDGLVLCGASAERVLEHELLGKGSGLEPTSRLALPCLKSYRGMSGNDWSTQIDGIPFNHLDVLVGSDSDKRRCGNVTFHQWKGCLPPNGILKLTGHGNDNVFVASGPFLALIEARSLSLTGLAQLVMYLCGMYCKHQSMPLASRRPLSTKEQIEMMLRSVRGTMGWKRLSRILPYCAEGVRSPQEANFYLMATLPNELNGYHLTKPEVNASIPLNSKQALLAGAPEIEVDFYWPDANAVVEYNGLDYHEGGISPLDVTQQYILQDKGIEVIFLTKEQFNDARLLDLLMRYLARRLGVDSEDSWPSIHGVQQLISDLKDPYSTSNELINAQRRWIRRKE